MPTTAVATAGTVAFFGGGSARVEHLIQPPLVISDVSQDEAGLQQLAIGARWHAVAALAERLESQRLDSVTMLPTEASLRCTVARVQAYIKLEQYDSARRLFETLGNLSDSRFSRPLAGSAARRSIVPFTLLFLQAQLPGLCGHLAESQERLYALLQHADAQQVAASGERLVWRHRSKRLLRALVANHFELEQFASALKLQRELADTESNELTHMLAMQQLGCMCLRSGNSFLATEVFKTLERMPVDDESLDDATNEALQQTKEVVCAVNHALLLSFHGYFIEACATLRNVMSAVPVVPAGRAATTIAAANATTTTTTTTIDQVQAVLQAMRRNAVNSLVACVPFFHRNDAPDAPPALGSNSSVSIPTIASLSATKRGRRPSAKDPTHGPCDDDDGMDHPLASTSAPVPQGSGTPAQQQPPAPPIPCTNLQSLIRFLEDHIRADPRGMLLMDATIMNLARLYDLENAVVSDSVSGSRQDQLENLLEQFRGNKEGARALSKR